MMNAQKFVAPSTKDAYRKVRETLGADANIHSSRKLPDGRVEVIASAFKKAPTMFGRVQQSIVEVIASAFKKAPTASSAEDKRLTLAKRYQDEDDACRVELSHAESIHIRDMRTIEMQVMTLEPKLERLMLQAINGANGVMALEPGFANGLLQETAEATRRQEELNLPAMLLVPDALRFPLSRFLRRSVPQLEVIAHNEVPETRFLKVTSIIGGKS
ncbi:MAG: FHIPEP family type III secretion protein [Zoogloeaceae bacterium]|jgi:flagellar biosynthesis GTPase FlhF|nr:FHIPEP family type III secretion protein [Zoogloeaceae bacterium]